MNDPLFEVAVLHTMPFADSLIKWCDKQKKFRKALKFIYFDKFLHLGAISIHNSEFYPKDEVIGFYAYAYRKKNPIFKQDFIINLEKRHMEYILYTTNPYGNSKYVKSINDLKDKNLTNLHHLSYDQLPTHPEMRRRAARIIYKGEVIEYMGGIKERSRQELRNIINRIIEIRNKEN